MDFPAYVPAAVRDYIAALIEGDPWEPKGWATVLVNADEELNRIDRAIETYLRRGEDDYLPSLRAQRVEALAHRNSVAGEVDCLRRLAHDTRMHEAFALLTCEFTGDEQWRRFIRAARVARVDFAKHRDRIKLAAELQGKIADTAEKLAALIRQFSDIGLIGPDDFYSIPELLRQTENHEMQGHNLHMWQSMRRHVLGDALPRNNPETEPAAGCGLPVRHTQIDLVPMSGKPTIAPEEEARNLLRYAWGTAPDFPALLGTVAKAAQSFSSDASGMIGAALQSRQRSPKTEYLRAFGSLLTDAHGVTLTTTIMQAVAIVANVVINLPDVDVTYDDVRKALARLGG